MNNVFVYIEIEDKEIADVSLELLTKGRELANTLGVKLEAVNSFEFHSCERTPQVDYLLRLLRHRHV